VEENSFVASRDEEKLAAGLLRQSLRDSAEPCPDAETLAAYFEQSLEANEKARFELHLSQCSTCREQLAAMHRANEPAVAASARAERAHLWAWLWNWPWLAPVVGVLVIAGVWIARRPATKPAAEQPVLVAMSKQTAAPNASPAPRASQSSPGPTASTAIREYARNESAPAPAAPPPPKPAPPFNPVAGSPEKSLSMSTAPPTSNEQALAPNPSSADKENQTDLLAKKDESAERGLNAPSSADEARKTAPPSQSSAVRPASEEGSLAEPRERRQVIPTSEANSIGPQPAVETNPRGASTAAQVSAQRMQPAVRGKSAALALDAVETRTSMRIIRTPDPKVLWRIVGGRFIERSIDGSVSWKGGLLDVDVQLTAGFAPSATVCWVVGRGGAIFLTTNASDWKRIQPPVDADFIVVTAQDALSAIVTSADGRKFITTDGGTHWNPAP